MQIDGEYVLFRKDRKTRGKTELYLKTCPAGIPTYTKIPKEAKHFPSAHDAYRFGGFYEALKYHQVGKR